MRYICKMIIVGILCACLSSSTASADEIYTNKPEDVFDAFLASAEEVWNEPRQTVRQLTAICYMIDGDSMDIKEQAKLELDYTDARSVLYVSGCRNELLIVNGLNRQLYLNMDEMYVLLEEITDGLFRYATDLLPKRTDTENWLKFQLPEWEYKHVFAELADTDLYYEAVINDQTIAEWKQMVRAYLPDEISWNVFFDTWNLTDISNEVIGDLFGIIVSELTGIGMQAASTPAEMAEKWLALYDNGIISCYYAQGETPVYDLMARREDGSGVILELQASCTTRDIPKIPKAETLEQGIARLFYDILNASGKQNAKDWDKLESQIEQMMSP